MSRIRRKACGHINDFVNRNPNAVKHVSYRGWAGDRHERVLAAAVDADGIYHDLETDDGAMALLGKLAGSDRRMALAYEKLSAEMEPSA
jgi:hypothetical protein